MFTVLKSLFLGFGQRFSLAVFIYGPRYTAVNKAVHVLLNFVSGQAKLAIWLSRKNRIKGLASDQVVPIMKGLIKARIKVEFEYYKLTDKMEKFIEDWCVNDVLASVRELCLTFNV